MNSKQKMINSLMCKKTNEIPVAPHWWGLFKFQLSGLINGYETESLAWNQSAQKLFEIDSAFYEQFKPDMFHLTTAPNQKPWDKNKLDEIEKLKNALCDLDSKTLIDEYISLIWRTEKEITDSREFEHVELCSKKYGEDVLISLNEGSDTAVFFDSHLGFENGLIGLLENEENVSYMMSKLYDRTLERLKALKKAGAHAYINSETYCSADIMSPLSYKNIFLPIQKKFYAEVQKIGLIPITYFTGDITPMLEMIKELDINGLMVEASKKTFQNDVGEMVKKLENKIALFGNLDSFNILEKSTVDEVKKETLSQLNKVSDYPFIMSNDCPISFNTPIENIKCMIQTTKEFNKC